MGLAASDQFPDGCNAKNDCNHNQNEHGRAEIGFDGVEHGGMPRGPGFRLAASSGVVSSPWQSNCHACEVQNAEALKL